MPDRQHISGRTISLLFSRSNVYGLATRISLAPHPLALYRTQVGPLHVEAIPIDYDAAAWREAFLAQWPEGSDAHASYWRRISHGPRYDMARAVRAT